MKVLSGHGKGKRNTWTEWERDSEDSEDSEADAVR